VFHYGAPGSFPNLSWQSTNYWVDPILVTSAHGLFASTATPAIDSSADTASVEIGTRFTASVNGKVYGVRFYKGTLNTGVHTGSLWAANGSSRLATATFTNESASGWQTVRFAQPIDIVAGQVYLVSYHTNVGRYAFDRDAFAVDGVTVHELSVPSGGGAFRYGSGGSFPDSQSNHNYWVDVVFVPLA
jgi:hypothetical protein